MKKIKKHIFLITIIFIVIISLGGIILKISLINQNLPKEEIKLEEKNEIILEEEITEEETTEEKTKKIVYVDIKGAVKNPGVYEIEDNKKVIDVINLAGGFNENADTSLINLAKKVTNEMVIIIYTKEEIEKSKEENTVVKIIEKECICPEIKNDACLENNNNSNNDEHQIETSDKKININSANIDELLQISGIGESKAKAIIEHRKEFGDFSKIEDIMNVSGIGEALYEKIKNNITV